ncbi:MAG TPA: hypothetical protein VIY29_24935 [Ktedonobacteraceae bacterium]
MKAQKWPSSLFLSGKKSTKNVVTQKLFDLRQRAIVHNLCILARSQSLQADLQNAA